MILALILGILMSYTILAYLNLKPTFIIFMHTFSLSRLFYGTWLLITIGFGRIVYLTSKLWNWKIGQVTSFLSVFIMSLGCVVSATLNESYLQTMTLYMLSLVILLITSTWGYLRCAHAIIEKT